MAWEENSHICLHMQLIAILSRIEVTVYFTLSKYHFSTLIVALLQLNSAAIALKKQNY